MSMSTSILRRTNLGAYLRPISRLSALQTRALTTSSSSSSATSTPPLNTPISSEPTLQSPPPLTHFKITLRRSAISLGDKIKGTLLALGFHRRHQTVYHPHGPEVAGKILRVKELVEVENVPTHMVMTAGQQRQARKAPRGYKVVGTRRGAFMGV
ncbi:hypothetical protein BDN70DRAFT_883691 [Pholiota conissans]|uniref:Large ribosomal subunit protein uL30m n=1 Tax=Pholiota conissans TaxID=109636 RepID=A0A9P5YUM2_9AGAR|nr:hypothetical protein BDN70DRAFT_883691 [Pholiota conissans]